MESVLDLICKTGNYPDGQKIVEAQIRYSCPVDPNSLTPSAYRVQNRTITDILVQEDTVVLRLNLQEPFASVIPTRAELPENQPVYRCHIELLIQQVEAVRSLTGQTFPAWETWQRTNCAVEPVVETFRQWEYSGLRYNLYSPKWSLSEKYPIVVFLHDARPCGEDPKLTLSQGMGAICWAEPAWQDEHPCFVLAPQIPAMMVNDSFQATEDLDKVHNLICHILRSYPIDPDRVYITGQSMGCMGACELICRDPELFGGALLAAGQWEPERMQQSGFQNLWVLVSQHDTKAFPGMNAVMDAIESARGKVSRASRNAKSPELEEQIASQAAEPNPHYTVFAESSVVPAGVPDHPGTNHEYTWQTVYQLRNLKEWLFAQSKSECQ